MIGAVGTISGPAGAALRGLVDGVKVWVTFTNARGGMNGHQVRYIVADDGGDPAKHLALLQQMKERQKVLAFVANPEPFANSSIGDWHRRNGIPVIGTEGGNNYVYENPMYFPTAPSGDELGFATIAALAQAAVPQGLTKLGILTCVEADACASFERVWTSPRAAALGFTTVYRGKASFTQPDFTAECLGARNAGVQVLGLAMDANSWGRIATACHRQDYWPVLGTSTNPIDSGTRVNPVLDGMIFGSQTFPWVATDNSARQEFHAAFATYASGTELTPFNAVGWISAKVFEAATRNLPEPPTTQAILDGLWTIKDNDLGGLTYPLTYTRNEPAPRRACWSVVLIKDKQFQAPSGGNLTCEKK